MGKHGLYQVRRKKMTIDPVLGGMATTGVGGAFLGGVCGYACKKALKIVAILIGVFIMGLGALEYYRMVKVDWNTVQGNAVNGTQWFYHNMMAIQHHISAQTGQTTVGLGVVGFASGFALGFAKG